MPYEDFKDNNDDHKNINYPILITNLNKKKIKTKVILDEKYKMWRIEVKLKRTKK